MRVHAIQTGRVRIKASQIVGRGHGLARRLAPLTDPEWSEWLPTCAYAIEHREGVILVDTGASASLGRLPRWHPYFRLAVRFAVEPEQEAGAAVRALGVAPADVRRVILTHMHIDHDSGLAGFPASEILVSPGELAIASGLAGRLRGYLPERWPKSFDPKPLDPRQRRLRALRPLAPADRPTGRSSRSRPRAIRGTISRSSSRTATRLSSSPATPPTTKRPCYAGRIDGVGADESAELATLAAIRAFAASRPTIYLPAHDPGRRPQACRPMHDASSAGHAAGRSRKARRSLLARSRGGGSCAERRIEGTVVVARRRGMR